MAGDFPCFDATTATRLRRLQGPQLKQGGLERVVEAFYIAKMKYEHEARLSTPGQQVGKRARRPTWPPWKWRARIGS